MGGSERKKDWEFCGKGWDKTSKKDIERGGIKPLLSNIYIYQKKKTPGDQDKIVSLKLSWAYRGRERQKFWLTRVGVRGTSANEALKGG